MKETLHQVRTTKIALHLILVLASLYFMLIGNFSNAQGWGASSFSQTTNEAVDVEVNSSNQSYVAGYISGQTSFGTLYEFPDTQGNTDIYVVKYSATGTVIWLKQFGGTQADRAIDLALGPDGNIVVTGQFFGSVTFGATTLNSSAGSKDIFIVKLDAAGNVLWARKEGGNSVENAYKVTVDHQNNVIVTGEYQGTATIGSSTFTSTNDPGTGNPSFDIFVSKYDSNGTPLWAVSGYADYDDRGMAVSVDNSDNIYVAGQFSDTLVFAGNTYNNNSFNIGFLCKLNPTGQVQFFNQLKAGLTVPYDVKVNQLNESVVIGDFLGNMNYYHQGGVSVVQNPYEKQIFAIKTNSSGQHQWNTTLGSENELSARALAIDSDNSSFITGYFRCDLSQLQDTAENLYSSVGFKDPYLMKLTSSGSRTYVKQFGGKQDDEGQGVAVNIVDKPLVCGSYTTDLNFQPGAAVALGGNNFTFNPFYGAEPYHLYLMGDQSRNSYLVNHVNTNYGTYDYHTVASSDSIVGQINGYEIQDYVTVVNDTVHFCMEAELSYGPMTYNHAGPGYESLWYDGTTTPQNTVSATGNYWGTFTRLDGCEFDVDSIYCILEPTPTLPLLTDDHGVNVLQPGPEYNDYHFCEPESAELTFSNLGPGVTVVMTGPTQTFIGPGPHTVDSELQYNVRVENEYCVNNAEFLFVLDQAIPPDSIVPAIVMETDVPTGDSIQVCQGFGVQLHGIDLIVNPSANFSPQIYPPIDTVMWTINGNPYPNSDTTALGFIPTTTGWHTIQMTVVMGYDNLCGVDTAVYTVSQQFYIQVNPLPTWNPNVAAIGLLCPGESAYLVAQNPHPDLSWGGSNIQWSNGYDSILVNSPGWYNYSGQITDPVTLCSYTFVYNQYVGVKNPPEITCDAEGGIKCPFDSVLLAVPTFYSNYVWTGPSGDTLSTGSTCYGSEIGLYTCSMMDADGCYLTSVPFEVFEYSTPSVSAEPSNVLCSNNPIVIEITSSGEATFVWQHDGSTNNQVTVTEPGTYIVDITQCGVTITDSVVIVDGTVVVTEIFGDSILCLNEDGVFFVNTVESVEWFCNGASLGTENPISISYATLEEEPAFSVIVSSECYTNIAFDTAIIIPQGTLTLSEDTLQLCYDESATVEVLTANLDSTVWTGPFGSLEDDELTIYGNQIYPSISVIGYDEFGCTTLPSILTVIPSDYLFQADVNFPNFCPGTDGNIVISTNSDSVFWVSPFGNFDTTSLGFAIDQQTSGIHYIETFDSFGCSYLDTVSVLVTQVPTVNLVDDTVFCLNDMYSISFPNDGNTYVWSTFGETTSIPILSNQDLILTVTTPDGCSTSDTLFVETADCEGPLPNIITPNGDGVNDYFYFDDALSQLNNELIIYNRWGNWIYQASPYTNNYGGEDVSDGVYFYIYYPEGKDHPEGAKQGFLQIMK